jgi:uncharacterized membrane protein HdeD (DUF308 family)
MHSEQGLWWRVPTTDRLRRGTATATLARILVAIVGLALIASGVLYGTLGLWGVDRGSPDAWMLALLGLLGIGIGAGLLGWALRSARLENANHGRD